MTDVKSAVRQVVAVLLVTLGTVGVASALPMDCGSIDVDYTASGQITLNVYGDLAQSFMHGSLENGRFSGASASWDPLSVINGDGTIQGMAVFGTETADVSDDFVRFWIAQNAVTRKQVWVMPVGPAIVGLSTPGPAVIVNPEPATMILFGSGLVGLAAAVRRRRNRERR